MNEPRRFLDDPELSSLLREDLAQAASDADVSFDSAAGLARLQGAIAPGGPVPAPGGTTGAAAAGAGGKGLILGAITLGVAGVIGVAGYLLGTRPALEPPKAASTAVLSATQAASAPEPLPTAELSIDDLPSEKAPAASAASAAKPEASVSPEERLRAEMKQLAEIRSAPPARALELANQGHQRFKGGVFYQEREALAISALRALGRTSEAKARAQAFLTNFPRGPYAERVRKESGLSGP